LRQRVLVDVSECSTAATVLGQKIATPVLVAPTAYHALAHDEAELATVRGAGRAGTIMVVSSLATRSLEAIAQAATGPLWFQLYTYRQRSVSEQLMERAATAGYKALVVTVDVPVQGRRERDVRNGFRLPDSVHMANFDDQELAAVAGDSALAHYIAAQFDPSLTWSCIEWIRSHTALPIVVKGIMSAEDARLAVEHGAAAIVVSNHGGRQLDGGQATAEVLAEVVQEVHGQCEVYVDGGLRRGGDVLKALALGAGAVLVGRPVLWGLAVDGEDGVAQVLGLLTEELRRTMQFCGLANIAAIQRDVMTR
jgi:4-hydroxymandelate oxidase